METKALSAATSNGASGPGLWHILTFRSGRPEQQNDTTKMKAFQRLGCHVHTLCDHSRRSKPQALATCSMPSGQSSNIRRFQPDLGHVLSRRHPGLGREGPGELPR
jgi:hypothetical protein